MAKLFEWVDNGTNDSEQINSHFDKLVSDALKYLNRQILIQT